jgi:AraC family transcriptional regulator
MSESANRSAYDARMHRVLEHIERKLDEPLDLAALAEVANFSPFHFHRLFAAWTGARVGDYVRRRRLEVAALRLVTQPTTGILDIALTVGFGSAEAFARSFKQRFGYSPTSWREKRIADRRAHRNPNQMVRNFDQILPAFARENNASLNLNPEVAMKVRIIDRQPVSIAYLRHIGPYSETVGNFWGNTVYPWLSENGLLDQPRYGISHDDPSVVDPSQCRYDACVEVRSSAVLTRNAQRTTIPGGRYAVLAFEGTGTEIGEAWSALMRDWLPLSGLQLDARPCFEYYPTDAKYDPDTGVFSCDVCIPVV